MNGLTKAAVALAATIAALSPAVAVADVQAAAACTIEKTKKGNGRQAWCTDGGYYRLWLHCKRPGGYLYWSKGNRENYDYSEAYCASNEVIMATDLTRG